MADFDAIVIGAGANGLSAAALMGRAGLKVLVMERGPRAGGLMAAHEFYPGFKGPVAGDWLMPLPDDMLFDLDLGAHGLATVPYRSLSVLTGRDPPLVLDQDAFFSVRAMAAQSPADGERLLGFRAELARLRRLLSPLMQAPPPSPLGARGGARAGPGSAWGRSFLREGQSAALGALRFLGQSVRDVLDARFTSDAAKVALAAPALRGVPLGPYAAGSAVSLLSHPFALGDPEPDAPFSFGVQVLGGAERLTEALAASASAAGVEIRFDTEVTSVPVRDGRGTGVRLTSGKTISAGAVLSSLDVKRSVMSLFDLKALPQDFVRDTMAIRTSGVLARLLFALDRPPLFSGMGQGEPTHAGPIHMVSSLEAMERGFDAWKRKVVPNPLWLEVTVPTVLDPSLAPPGRHILSVTAHHIAYALQDGPWTDGRRNALAGHVLQRLAQFAPDLQESVLGQLVMTPDFMEATLGITGGAYHDADLVPAQSFFNRPLPELADFRLPVRNVYLCGAGMHPGAHAPGAAGLLAARQVISDLTAPEKG